MLVCGVVIYGEDYTKVPPPNEYIYIPEWTEDFWSEHFSIKRAQKLRKRREKEWKRKETSPAPRKTTEEKSHLNAKPEINTESGAKKESPETSAIYVESKTAPVDNSKGKPPCLLSKARRSSPHFLEKRRITRYACLLFFGWTCVMMYRNSCPPRLVSGQFLQNACAWSRLIIWSFWKDNTLWSSMSYLVLKKLASNHGFVISNL